MTTKKIFLFFILPLTLLSFLGCQPDTGKSFFGIAISDPKNINSFSIKSYTDGSVNYTYIPNEANKSITAWAKLNYGTIKFTVTNESSFPISTNYFLDEFFAVSNKGKIYQLNKSDIDIYPDESYINPHQTAEFICSYPTLKENEDIALLYCSLGGTVSGKTIMLKPVPLETIPTQNIN